MATQVQHRRGTTSQHSTFTGAVGEITIDTDKDTIIVHDGGTTGGFEIVNTSTAQTLTNKTITLGGDLDLNSNDITGTGNINITGNITASGNLAGTLTTASQPNITSVGTLTSATVSGDLTVDTTTLVVDSADNRVAINKGTPDYTLDVNGDIRVGVYNAPRIIFMDTSNEANSFAIKNNNSIFTIDNVDASGTVQNAIFRVDHQSSEAMRIDSSGNVLVGTTDFGVGGTTNTGIALNPNGPSAISRSSNPPITLNRTTDDGTIALFRKDGSTIGSIGTAGGDIVVGTGNVGLRFNDSVNIIEPWDINSNNSENNTIDLGYSGGKFKDLYLGGSVYLGGTGSANALDDYEEGEYQATISVPSGSITLNTSFDTLRYTKIGRMVNVSGQIRVSSVSSPSGSPVTVSLPFANNDGSELSERTAGVLQLYQLGSMTGDVVIHIVGSNSYFQLMKLVSGTHVNIDGNEFSGDEEIEFNLTYFTNS